MLDNITINLKKAAATAVEMIKSRHNESLPLPPIRVVTDYKTPADTYVVLPVDELWQTSGDTAAGTLAAHPWGTDSFQARFTGQTGTDLLVLATSKECVIGASGVVGWSLIYYADGTDEPVSVDVLSDDTTIKSLSISTPPFANEWYTPILTPTEFNKQQPTDAQADGSSSIKLRVTAGTLKVAALVALTADVDYISYDDITFHGTWGEENSRSGMPGMWTNTKDDYAVVRADGKRLEWLVSGNPGSKSVDIYSGRYIATAVDTTGSQHVFSRGGLRGERHIISCAEANPSGDQTDGWALHVGGAVVYKDR